MISDININLNCDSSNSFPESRCKTFTGIRSPCKHQSMSITTLSPFKKSHNSIESSELPKNCYFHEFPDKFLHSFEVFEELGQGFQARVYKIKEKLTNKYYAAKVYKPGDPEGVERIQKEFEIISRIKHENIAQLIHYFPYEEEETYIMCYELFLDYVTLKEYIFDLAPEEWTYKTYQSIISQILKAMSYCHSISVVHGDISLTNIMISPQEKTIKIIDFGTSKIISEDNTAYSPIGDLDFRPPDNKFFFLDAFAAECWSVGLILLSVALKEKITTKRAKKIWTFIEERTLQKNLLKVLKGLTCIQSEERLNLASCLTLLEETEFKGISFEKY